MRGPADRPSSCSPLRNGAAIVPCRSSRAAKCRSDLMFARHRNRLLLLLIAVTLAVLAWNEYGMNSVLAIAPDSPYPISTVDDRREKGGTSVASVKRDAGK